MGSAFKLPVPVTACKLDSHSFDSDAVTARIRLAHDNFSKGLDYHRPLLDMYLPKQGEIAEVGCGVARISAHYGALGFKITGYDLDQRMISLIREVSPSLDLVNCDAFDLPLQANQIDAYVGLGILELDESGGARCLREAYRVLKPAGLLYLSVPNRNIWRKRGAATWRGNQIPCFSEAEIQILLEASGFRVSRIRPSSIAHGLGPLRKLARLFPDLLIREKEDSWLYRLAFPLLKPLANSIVCVAYKR